MPGMDHLLSKGFLATGGSVAYQQFQVVQQVNLTTGPLAVINQAQCQINPLAASLAALKGTSIVGVTQESLDAVKTATGKAIIGVAMQGNTKVIWDGSGTPSVNAWVVPSYTGAAGGVPVAGGTTFITKTTTFTGVPIVGIPLTLPAVAGDIYDVQLMIGDYV
jgi:hypothetical protein